MRNKEWRKIRQTVREHQRIPRNAAPPAPPIGPTYVVHRGYTTTALTAASGAQDGSVTVQEYRFDGTNWVPTVDPPVVVMNDSKQSTSDSGYRCKWVSCGGFRTLLTMDCTPG